VYRRLVISRRVGPEHAAARAAFEAAILGRSLNRRIYTYAVEGTIRPEETTENREETEEARGLLCISDPRLEQKWCWSFTVTAGTLLQRQVALDPSVDRGASVAPFRAAIRLRDLAAPVREEIARSALKKVLSDSDDRIRAIHEDTRAPMELLVRFGVPVPEIHRSVASYVLGRSFLEKTGEITYNLEALPPRWWQEVEEILDEAERLGVSAEVEPLARELSERTGVLLERALAETDRERTLEITVAAYETLAEADRLKLPLPRTWLEPRVYELVLRYREELAALDMESTVDESVESIASSGLTALRRLAGHANLQLEAILSESRAQIEANLALPPTEGRIVDAQG